LRDEPIRVTTLGTTIKDSTCGSGEGAVGVTGIARGTGAGRAEAAGGLVAGEAAALAWSGRGDAARGAAGAAGGATGFATGTAPVFRGNRTVLVVEELPLPALSEVTERK
jgi:hypothetical protein